MSRPDPRYEPWRDRAEQDHCDETSCARGIILALAITLSFYAILAGTVIYVKSTVSCQIEGAH